MDQTLKITKIETIIQKGTFGGGKYFGYGKYKIISLAKVTINKNFSGFGECLVGVYSPELFKLNLTFISKFIYKKNLTEALKEIQNLQKNKFFFDAGILKSILSSLEIAIFDIMSQVNKITLAETLNNYFLNNDHIAQKVDIYASAGSIKSNLKDLKNEILTAKNIGIERFKARLDINKNESLKKIKMLKDETSGFAIDLIANTYAKNQNIKNLNLFLGKIKKYNPLWIEEILTKNDLLLFVNFKKMKLKFSYGENFNSYNDFVNLLVFYKFNYINPDISHLTISDFFKLYYFIKKNNLKQKIIMHCWGGSINLFTSLSVAANIKDVVKFVEFPITDFSLNKPFINNSNIKNSKYFFDNEIKNNSDLIKQRNFKLVNLKKLTFNFN